MLRMLIVVVVVFVVGTAGIAHAEFIGIFKDTNGCPCEITDRGAPGVISIVVLHVEALGATASQFRVEIPGSMVWAWVGETSFFPIHIGNSMDGIAVSYGGDCLSGTFQILSIDFFVQGLAPECSYVRVVPDPNTLSGEIEIVDCSSQVSYGYSTEDIVNSNVSCQCAPGPVSCYPVPVNETTWGGVKSLYN